MVNFLLWIAGKKYTIAYENERSVQRGVTPFAYSMRNRIDKMEQWKTILEDYLNEKLVQMILSNPRSKDGAKKIQIRPMLLKGVLIFQASEYKNNQVFHHNLTGEEVPERVAEWMEQMRQLEVEHQQGKVHALVSKKGKVTVKTSKHACTKKQVDLSHNRAKKYILDPEVKVPFLVDLGVQTKEGKIVNSRYDKFRQINRFLEFIEDILPALPRDREVVILDFGCGKSYLTFAMYYYLHELKKYDIRIVGLDLKTEVIAHCNQLKEAYGYEKLTFLAGDIADYEGVDQVDMVVTLHACDTATDYALDKAIRWGAKVILSVPCCQHEVNGQIENEWLQPVLKYGLLKERMSALITDAIRANLLEEAGYQVQILEFIDMEHTPKNILIRGVKTKKAGGKMGESAGEKTLNVHHLIDELHISPTLDELRKKEAADE